jgi:hypothetical protein
MGQRAEPFKQQLAYDEQRSLYDYWRSKCRPERLPTRHDLHPRDMVQFLPFITLTDVARKHAHFTFRVRLAGTGLRRVLDQEITGCTLDELPFGGQVRDQWRQIHERVVAERSPLCGVTPLVCNKAGMQDHAALAQFWVKFPLAGENGKVCAILAYDIFTPLTDLSPGLKFQAAHN